MDAGIAAGVAITEAENVDGLLGPSSSIGASGGYLGYFGIDMISFEDMSDLNGDMDGAQLAVGIGAGIDVHMTETYTQEICSFNMYDWLEKQLLQSEKRDIEDSGKD